MTRLFGVVAILPVLAMSIVALSTLNRTRRLEQRVQAIEARTQDAGSTVIDGTIPFAPTVALEEGCAARNDFANIEECTTSSGLKILRESLSDLKNCLHRHGYTLLGTHKLSYIDTVGSVR